MQPKINLSSRWLLGLEVVFAPPMLYITAQGDRRNLALRVAIEDVLTNGHYGVDLVRRGPPVVVKALQSVQR